MHRYVYIMYILIEVIKDKKLSMTMSKKFYEEKK